MATYDAIPRVAEVAGAEIYAKALLLVDEYHRLLFDYSFRHRAVTGLLAEMPKFSRATYMSATPIEREFLLDELQALPTTRIIWPNEPPMQVRLWHENSPLASVVNLCHNAVTHNIPCNLHFFVNSVDFIGRVLHHARLSPDEVKIVCSTSGTSEQINREKLGDTYTIGIPDKAVRKINFYTSTAFEGCDIYDKQGKIYVVSDGTARHHLLDVSTTIRQIAGRIRDTRYKEITHIFSTVRYAEGITYPQFKAATEKELDKAERFVK